MNNSIRLLILDRSLIPQREIPQKTFEILDVGDLITEIKTVLYSFLTIKAVVKKTRTVFLKMCNNLKNP